MLLTDAGIVTDSNLFAPWNAFSPILLTVFGTVYEVL